jgi:hypothetical protein
MKKKTLFEEIIGTMFSYMLKIMKAINLRNSKKPYSNKHEEIYVNVIISKLIKIQ